VTYIVQFWHPQSGREHQNTPRGIFPFRKLIKTLKNQQKKKKKLTNLEELLFRTVLAFPNAY
jgi:hypothetical protein